MDFRRLPKKSAQTLSADTYTPVHMVFCYFVGGVTIPPCGVPVTGCSTRPSVSSMPAFSHFDATTSFADGDFRKTETRFAPENLPQNLALVDLLKDWATKKQATPAQISLAWLMAQKPWIVPIPGTTQMAHMLENIGTDAVRFTSDELAELNQSIAAIKIRGAHLLYVVQAYSGVAALQKN